MSTIEFTDLIQHIPICTLLPRESLKLEMCEISSSTEPHFEALIKDKRPLTTLSIRADGKQTSIEPRTFNVIREQYFYRFSFPFWYVMPTSSITNKC